MWHGVTEYVKNHTLYDCIDVNLIANSYDGVDDSELASIINNNPELREHLKDRQPPVLCYLEPNMTLFPMLVVFVMEDW